ncbi:MAG TPA: GtrA family protein, partial [Burkholderiaceae bacterium]
MKTSSARQQFLLFAVAGVLGLLVDVAVLYAVAPLLGWYAARVLSFLSAASFTWWFNRRWTFTQPASRDPIFKQYAKYLASMAIGGCVNYAVYAATLHWLHMPGAALLGVALGSVAGMGFNFLCARYIVFR